QLGLTFQEIIDFGFVFQDAGFLQAMAKRGIDTPAELAKGLVTPLTPGSFGLPEEKRRIVKAQMYNAAGAGINLFARPIEGVQAIVDLDDRKVLAMLDTGLVPVSAQTADFDEATVVARFGLRPALKPLRPPSRRERTSRSTVCSSAGRNGNSTSASSGERGPSSRWSPTTAAPCCTRERWPRSSS